METYYNEIDNFCCQWMKELMTDGLINQGVIDERDIQDIPPAEIMGFDQWHLFSGIGVWSAALRAAGHGNLRGCLTVSCPCQPFSSAGKRKGTADERHLWPAAFHIISQLRPRWIFGEQVAKKDGLAWLDHVSADLEAAGYTVRAAVTCACGFGAPHIRQRLYFAAERSGVALGDSECPRLEGHAGDGNGSGQPGRLSEESAGSAGQAGRASRLASPGSERCEGQRLQLQPGQPGEPCTEIAGDGETCGLADTDSQRPERGIQRPGPGTETVLRPEQQVPTGLCPTDRQPAAGPVNGLWAASDWLFCRDGKWRPVEPGTFPLADAGSFVNRVAELRGAGNALCIAQAAEFITAVMEVSQ